MIDDLNFDFNSDGVFTIEKYDTIEIDFTIDFNENIDKKEYLSVLNNKNIFIGFNADSANQNDKVTRIEPEIVQDKS